MIREIRLDVEWKVLLNRMLTALVLSVADEAPITFTVSPTYVVASSRPLAKAYFLPLIVTDI